MNFFICSRCNKKSEDNILNFNYNEILLKNNSQNLINNNIINKIDSIDQYPNINIEDNIQTSINNFNNLEEQDDELQIIEYPYSKKEKSIQSLKIRHKYFQNNQSKFGSPNLIEKDILNQLNHLGNAPKPPRKNQRQIGRKAPNIKVEDELERKDTMTDPANIALSSLFQDINQKRSKNKEKYIKRNILYQEYEEDEDDIITINNETENNYFDYDNINNNSNNNIKNNSNNNINNKSNNNINNSNKNNKQLSLREKIPNRRKNNDNFLKKNILNKRIKSQKGNHNKNNVKKYNNIKRVKEKISQNKKISNYNSSIMKKKNFLKNQGIFSKNYNSKNIGINSYNFTNKKLFPKSYSFNCANSERKFNGSILNQKLNNNNELEYSLTISKKFDHLFNHIFNNDKFNFSKKNDKNKKKLKISHKKVSRTQVSIQKAKSSQKVLY